MKVYGIYLVLIAIALHLADRLISASPASLCDRIFIALGGCVVGMLILAIIYWDDK